MAFATAAGLLSLQSCSAGALSQLGSRAAGAALDALRTRLLRRGSDADSLDADGPFIDSARAPSLNIDDEHTVLRPMGGRRGQAQSLRQRGSQRHQHAAQPSSSQSGTPPSVGPPDHGATEACGAQT